MPHKPGNGAIFGIVSEDGVAATGAPVSLYDRTNGAEVSHQLTDVNGGFVFNGLNPATSDYYVVATDETGPPYKNAIIQDRITPVPGYQGATYWGNWRHRAYSYGVYALFDGLTDATGHLIAPYSTSMRPTLRASAGITEALPTLLTSITPGAPQIPAIDMLGNKLFVPARAIAQVPSAGAYAFNQNPSSASLEVVADWSTIKSQISATPNQVYFSGGASYYAQQVDQAGNNYTGIITLYYNKAAKTLGIFRNNASGGGGIDQYFVQCGVDFDMTSYQATHHVIVTLLFGTEAKLYIDGTLVYTVSLPSTNASWGYYSNDTYGYFAYMGVFSNWAGSGVGFGNCSGVYGSVGAMAMYPSVLSSTQVAALYNDLMVGTTPALTGYVKEISIDSPRMYVRLNEPALSTSVQNATRPEALTNGAVHGGVTFAQASIVTGGNSALFASGGVRFNTDGGVPQWRNGYTLEWIGMPTVATPSAAETILKGMNPSLTVLGPWLQRLTNGHLSLQHQASGTETLNFTTAMSDTTAQHHFMIVVDKIAHAATLYVDGAQVEQLTTNSTLLDVQVNGPQVQYLWTIGAHVDNASALTSTFGGTLTEVAFYEVCLTSARAAAHYAARLIA